MKNARSLFPALGFLTPNILGFIIFLAGPLVVSLVMAFTNWSLRKGIPLEFVGLDNFKELLSSSEFWVYLINTLYFMIAIPIGIAGSLCLALLLNKPLTSRTWLGRFIHGGIILFAVFAIASAIRSYNTDAAKIISGLVLLMGVVYCLAVFAGIVVYRTLYYLPSFTSGVALFILWKSLYNPQTGPINGMIDWILSADHGAVYGLNCMLSWIHLGPITVPSWLSPPEWLASTRNLLGITPMTPGFSASQWGLGAREAIMIMGVVTGIGGGNMLLYLAGLSNIPPELYEAADIDGANPWQRFWHVTWPQLAPTTFFITIMSFIGGLQGGFETARVMTNGGPRGSTTTLSYFIYNYAFGNGTLRLGYASAIAWVLFLLVFIVTAINWRFGNRQLND